ncbi:kanadaptin [Chelonus insularis]|uniref:kanadaptin n=1 Tax=Chelonus insularis TaxID=460826 RepID=UPI00158DFD6B|nr:kanadaptin [Chelonus insularis]
MESNNNNSNEQSVESSSNQNNEKNNDEEKLNLTKPQVEQQEESKSEDELLNTSNQEQFKKPVLIVGPRKGKTGSIRTISATKLVIPQPTCLESDQTNTETSELDNTGQKNISDYKLPLNYKEPAWSGKPQNRYKIEVLKSGVILDTVDLTQKSFYVIGRLPMCDIPLAHPTISRFHAILQYRLEGDDKNGPGYYLYDLESTHGTFWNGCRIRPKTYVRLRGGHMVKFGCSQRKFIIQTPSDEVEEESEYSVSELKEMRRLELLKKEKEEKLRLEEEKMKKEKEEAEGIDWGISEDADEESDLAENPYAMTNNEELFLDDPKKTLRGWFEREGYDLQYQTEEKGVGQFLCWVELPIDASSKTVKAEALVKGKKKEAVIQCALEACRILDRYGLLRQATHEGRKRKSRNWEEEDYYDSDEDNFLDRTGTVERKREQRMRNAGKLEEKAETYTSLIEKHSIVVKEINKIEITLKNHNDAQKSADSNSNADALDAFMSNLSSAVLNKSDLMKLKMKLLAFKKEEEKLRRLVNIAKPATLPALNPPSSVTASKSTEENISSQKRQRTDDSQSKDSKDSNETKNTKEEQFLDKVHYGLISSAKEVDTVKKVEEENHNKLKDDENIETNKNKAEDNKKKIEEDEINKTKKKSMRKMKQKLEKEMQKNQDVYQENYSTWLPPENQSGDGRTSLNEKFGY